MPDSANILSILAALGQGQQDAPQTNVLQSVAPQAMDASAAPPVAAPAPAAAPPVAAPAPAAPPPDVSTIAQAAAADAPPAPRPRRSLADIIGHIADGLASAGGATPMYQATLDAEQKRAFDAQDQTQQVDLNKLKLGLSQQELAAGALKPEADARLRLGTALGALDGNPDAAALWPSIAAQAGIDPQHTAAIGKILTANPAAAGIFAKALGADKDNLGKNVLFGTDTSGKTVAYQVGPDGKPHILDFGGGITPNEPVKVVNTGAANVVIGGSGNVKKILPNTAKPDTVLTTGTQKQIADDRNRTAITIAGMPARATSGKGTSTAKAGDANVPTLLNNIEQGFNDLHKMNALPGEGGAIGQVEGAFGRSALGQRIGEQLGTPAAQKRLEIMKNVSALQQAMLKSLPASATRTRFEQEMLQRGLPDPSKMSLQTAQTVIAQLRKSYAEAVASLGNTTPVVRPAATSGWKIVGVK